MIVALIPARGGSRRIPNKNIKPFFGKPIIQYSIEAAQRSFLFDRIVVSTDSREIAAVARKCGAKVSMRSPAMSRDEVGTQEVARDFLKTYGRGKNITELCVIYATAPLLAVEDLVEGHDVLQMGYTQYVMSVGTTPALHDAGQFYWGKKGAFAYYLQLLEEWTRMIPIDPSRDCDINTPADWLRAEQMFLDLRR